MAKKNSNTAVATKPETGVAKFAYGDGPTGYENQTAEDQSIPLIVVLQDNSPQLKKSNAKHIAGASAGMLFNIATEECVDGDDGLLFVAALTQHQFVEFRPRDQGGGFVGFHETTDPIVVAAKSRSTQFGKYGTEAGNELVETFSIYAVLCDEQQTPLGFAVIPCSSMKIKPYKSWNNRVRAVAVNKRAVPLMANLCRLRTVSDKNSKGEFYNIRIDHAVDGDKFDSLIDPNGELFAAAVQFHELVQSGQRQAMAPQDATSSGDAGPDDPGTGDEGDAPF